MGGRAGCAARIEETTGLWPRFAQTQFDGAPHLQSRCGSLSLLTSELNVTKKGRNGARVAQTATNPIYGAPHLQSRCGFLLRPGMKTPRTECMKERAHLGDDLRT